MVLTAIVSQRLVPRRNGGRVLACELMIKNNAIANLIREQKSHQVYSGMEPAAREGMITMDRSVKDLFAAGMITRDEAIGLMRNPKDLQRPGE